MPFSQELIHLLHTKVKSMDGLWYLIKDIFEALYPAFKAVGRFGDAFFALSIAILSFYWIFHLAKNPDAIRSNKLEDQP